MLDPWYVTGFSDGEASFTYSRSARQLAVYFAIKLTATDVAVLEAIQAFFGVGRIYRVAASARNGIATKTAALYRVTRHDELPRITDHFDRYPLHGDKRHGYAIWREMVQLKKMFRNAANRDLMDDLADKLSAINPRNQS